MWWTRSARMLYASDLGGGKERRCGGRGGGKGEEGGGRGGGEGERRGGGEREREGEEEGGGGGRSNGIMAEVSVGMKKTCEAAKHDWLALVTHT